MSLVELIKYNPLSVYLTDQYYSQKSNSTKMFIFVATTGRSGSQSLAKIFNAVDDAVCFHEPYPIMFNDYADDGRKEGYFSRLFYKIKRINRPNREI